MRSILRRPALDDRDRGYVPVVLAEMALRAEGAADRDAARSLQHALRAIVAEETRRWSLDGLLAGLGLSVAFVLVIGAVAFAAGIGFGGITSVIIMVAAMVAIGYADRFLASRRISAAVGATITAHGFCGGCGYSLRGLDAADDGCLVCPECSAAWRPGRVTRAHWSRPLRALAPRPTRLLRAMFLRPPVIPDDRDMLCRRLDSWLLSVQGSRRAAIGPEGIRDVRAAIRRPTLWLRATLGALLLIPVIWLFTHMPATTADAERVALWTGWLLGLLVMAAVVFATLVGELGIRTRHLVGMCVERSLCASCAAELSAADAEGFRVCSACGASWKAIYRAEPPRPV